MPYWFEDHAGSRPSQHSEPIAYAELRDIVSHPQVVEVLDILAHGPVTLATMRTQIRGNSRRLERALRALAASGLVTGCGSGTWDGTLSRDRLYRLTDRGRQVVQELSRWSVWTAMLDNPE
jgi:DNA-binding transcriptional ArsR family regulator